MVTMKSAVTMYTHSDVPSGRTECGEKTVPRTRIPPALALTSTGTSMSHGTVSCKFVVKKMVLHLDFEFR